MNIEDIKPGKVGVKGLSKPVKKKNTGNIKKVLNRNWEEIFTKYRTGQYTIPQLAKYYDVDER